MPANVPFNYVLTTNAAGSFNVDSSGYIQGTALDSPNARYNLSSGILSQSETIPLWGGVGLYELIPGAAGTPSRELGGTLGRATGLATSLPLAGFSVFDQNHSAIQSPQSPVPLVGSGMTANFYRLGSGQRIVVQADPNLALIEGDPTTQAVSWDFQNQLLVPYSSTTVSSGTYVTATGAVSVTTAANHGLLPGDTFELSALTGTGGFASLDGEWTATAGTTGTTLNFTGPTGLGSTTITGGTLATGGILPVKVLDIEINKSMTVSYSSVTGFATWNRSGTTAVILI